MRLGENWVQACKMRMRYTWNLKEFMRSRSCILKFRALMGLTTSGAYRNFHFGTHPWREVHVSFFASFGYSIDPIVLPRRVALP